MSDLRVASLKGRKPGSAPSLPDGAVVSGVTTSTSFSGNVTGNVTGTATGKVTGNVTGNITGTAGTFSGNVSVGGVVTYEDVTSIDSVGVVTARAGIKIGAGQSVSAVSGIVTYYGDGSKLTGVESGVVNFVASGTIANGATVVVNTDGTVGIVTTTGSPDPSAGTPVVFESAGTRATSTTFDSNNNKVVIAYRDVGNNAYGTAVVGDVNPSNNSISFGTPVVFKSALTDHIAITYDSSNQRVVIVSYEGEAIVGTVSGTSISFGSPVVFESGDSYGCSAVYDPSNQKVVIVYYDSNKSNRGTAIVGTVSGNSISFGSAVVFESDAINNIATTYDSNSGKIVIGYLDTGNSDYGTAIVGTVSGSSISFGAATVFEPGDARVTSATYDSTNNKVIIAYRDLVSPRSTRAIVGTVSGTSISFGTSVAGSSVDGSYVSSTYDSNSDRTIVNYQDASNSDYGTSFVVKTTNLQTNLTAENYIGMSAEAIANGATGRINVLTGTNTGQTGLTTAQKYFVQPNGTLGTSPGSPSVVAGTAISGTKIIVR